MSPFMQSPMDATRPLQSGPTYLKQIENAIAASGVGRIVSLCGRYWAMDRDQRWERTEKAYDLLTNPTLPVSPLWPLKPWRRATPPTSPMSS